MKLAIVLIHNKGNLGNTLQIEVLKPLIEKQTVLHSGQVDFKGNTIPDFETYYYTIKGLTIPHEAKFYQIVPFGVNPPTNLYDIDSYKVFYGKGDEDKVGDHPRFFNWGLKRGTDYEADIVLQLDDVASLDILNLPAKLNALIEPTNPTEFTEASYGRMATKKLLKEVGQLDEAKNFDAAIIDLKERVIKKGFVNG